jgi:hypothetical protein
MSINHHLLAKTTTDKVLHNFKTGNWTSINGIGTDFYRIGCNSNFPSPDAAFRDDTNDITVTFEFKPPTETKRGILTGLGQSIAYLNSSNLSYLVIPETLEDYNIGEFISNLFTNQISEKLPVGLITYENNNPSNINLLNNVELLNEVAFSNPITNNRFWAKHQDLPIPLFHLLLHCYYLKKIGQIEGDAFEYCWNNNLFPNENLINLRATSIKDILGNDIYTLSGRKVMMIFEKKIQKIRTLRGDNKRVAVERLALDADSKFVGDNLYNSYKKNFVTFLKHIKVIDSNGELSEDGFKLYHLGAVNDPESKLFKDYFIKTILLTGNHLDLIFDLDNLCNEHKGAFDYNQIKQALLSDYENRGMIKRNPNRVAGIATTVSFLKYEDILWNSLDLKSRSAGIPNVRFNWKKITEVCSLPEL